MRWNCLLLVATLFLTACVANPYRNRLLDDGQGGQKTYPFAYGKFCGPGYPPVVDYSEPVESQDRLAAMWPPLDDIDAACYAHDQCLLQTQPETAGCDFAFLAVLNTNSTGFQSQGCTLLASDMAVAMLGRKNPPLGEKYGKAVIVMVQAIKAPLLPFVRTPEEGTCNLDKASRPTAIIADFASRYPAESARLKNLDIADIAPIEIPIGSSGKQRIRSGGGADSDPQGSVEQTSGDANRAAILCARTPSRLRVRSYALLSCQPVATNT